MQDNDIRITLKTLFTLGKMDAIKEIRDSLKRDCEYAEGLLGINKNEAVADSEVVDEKIEQREESPKKTLLYNKDWTYAEKFIFILKNKSRFMKFREVAEEVVEVEGKGDVDFLTRRLTASTRHLKLEGKIVKVSAGGLINTFWGLSKWLDDNGNIKKGYEYDKSSVSSSRKGKKETSGLMDDL
tara:strand:- start:915 stop:1466 length:552 start_codon:yes stop_codon:yes gene_type:complete